MSSVRLGGSLACVASSVGGPAASRYASKAHWGQITKALRTIYTAPTVDAAEARFADFEHDWGERYSVILKLWRQAWAGSSHRSWPSRPRSAAWSTPPT